MEYTDIVTNPISENTEVADTGPLFQIQFLEGGGRGIFRGVVSSRDKLCMSLVEYCNIASHAQKR